MFWENLRTLYYLVKYNNIKSVGFFLKIHPSTITRRIKQLEENFNKKLFIDYKNITLSQFGEEIFKYLYTSCENFEKLENKNIDIENLYQNNKFVIYFTDVYYYNVLLYLYDQGILCKYFFNIRYISIISHDVLNNLINSSSDNFVYITGDNHMFNNSSEYISLPIQEMPIYFYENMSKQCENSRNNHIMIYSGEERWLKDLYKNIDLKKKYVTNSNSIHILSKILHCVNEGILPNIYTKLNSTFKKTKIGYYKLILVFNKNNVVLQRFFASNTINNN